MMIDGKKYNEVPDGWALFWVIIVQLAIILAAVGAGVVVRQLWNL